MKIRILCIALFALILLPLRAVETTDTLRTVDLQEVVATGTRTSTDPRLLPVTRPLDVTLATVLFEELHVTPADPPLFTPIV